VYIIDDQCSLLLFYRDVRRLFTSYDPSLSPTEVESVVDTRRISRRKWRQVRFGK